MVTGICQLQNPPKHPELPGTIIQIGISAPAKTIVKLNDIEFEIGNSEVLELEDVEINKIEFVEDTNEKVYVTYFFRVDN